MSEDIIQKKVLNLLTICSIITSIFIGSIIFVDLIEKGSVEATSIIFVDSKGGGNYTKIQDAINIAKSGDTIYVWAGEYYENIVIDKKLTIIGNGSDNTIINGNKKNNHAMKIQEDWVNISGFKIINSGFFGTYNGIRIYNVDNISINNVNCSKNKGNGIFFSNSNNNKIINNKGYLNGKNDIYLYNSRNNIIKNNSCDIYLYKSSNNLIKNNSCDIYLQISTHNSIISNKMTNCGLIINGYNLKHWETNIILNNTVNAKPILYLKNKNSCEISNNVGQIILINCTNIIVEKQNISNTANGIHLAFSDNNILRNNTFKSNKNNGIYLKYSNNNKIENNICMFNGDNGIKIERSTLNKITKNYCTNHFNSIEQYYDAGIHIYNSGSNYINNNTCIINDMGILLEDACYNNTVSNNKCNNNGYGIYRGFIIIESQRNKNNSKNKIINKYDLSGFSNFIFNNDCSYSSMGITLIGYDKTIIFKNNISNTSCGLSLLWTNMNLLLENNCDNNRDYSISIAESDSNIIEKNNISNNNLGIKLTFSNHNLILKNNISNNYNTGFFLITTGNDEKYCSNNTITENFISNNMDNGILLKSGWDDNCRMNIISNNSIYNNGIGINIIRSHSNLIEKNIIINNEKGIFHNFSDYNQVYKNNFLRNKFGIQTDNTYNFNISNNLISNNSKCGVWLSSKSEKVYVHHNNFISNFIQAKDFGKNYWNNSHQEGNYWSDYKGLDNGENNRIVGDGIGDTDIPHSGLDYYPFVKQSGWLNPGIPNLRDPGNIDFDGNYNLSWMNTRNTIGYILEEAKNNKFNSSIVLYKGLNCYYKIFKKENGNYFYRVKAYNNYFESDWSNNENITVSYPANLPPQINNSIDNITIFEDTTVIGLFNLNNWFTDPNKDNLTYNVKNEKNITVDILSNGSVKLIPKNNWNGNVTIVFSANDSIYEVYVDVLITVLGVNDLPEKPIIVKPLNGELFENSTKIDFSGYGNDVDEIYGDNLNYTWISNITGIIGFGKELKNVTMVLGIHNISLVVTDSMNEFNQTNININVYNLSLIDYTINNITNNITDYDNDLIPDYWEKEYGLNISDPIDAQLDFDNDNLTNFEEYLNNTDPFNSDTDNDDFNDKLEVDMDTNPLDDKNYPLEEDEKNIKESDRIDYSIFLIIIGLIIFVLVMLILNINLQKKREKE